ncbi:MAG: mannonate dehydratase, partial [Bryobacteraceae bacterium]
QRRIGRPQGWNIGNSDVHNMEEVTLNLQGRDKKIEQFKQFLRDLGKAGLHYSTYARMGNGIWSSDRGTTRGGASARTSDLKTAIWAGKEFKGPLTHGRVFRRRCWVGYPAASPATTRLQARAGDCLRYFGKLGKLWKIHFRNVSAPIPNFTETFVDNGYMEMWKIMRALREVEFEGAVIGDHFPTMVGGKRVAEAYTIGYMKALLERANAEFAR